MAVYLCKITCCSDSEGHCRKYLRSTSEKMMEWQLRWVKRVRRTDPFMAWSQPGSSAVNGWAGFLLIPQPWSSTFSSAWCLYTISGIHLQFPSPLLFIWPPQIHYQEVPLLIRSKWSLCDWNWFWGEPSQHTVATKQPQTIFAAVGYKQRLELASLGCLLASSHGFPTWAADQND